MGADAEDLRFFYAEHLGRTEIKQATNDTSTPAKFTLAPGRYRVSFRTNNGALTVWAEQKKSGEDAIAAVPATPFELEEMAGQILFTTIIRNPPVSRTGETGAGFLNTLYFRTDAGTVDIVVTKISRE